MMLAQNGVERPRSRRGRTLLLAGTLLALSCSGEDAEKKPVNAPCVNNTDCADAVCHRGVCAAADPQPNGASCAGPGQCLSFSCSNGVCVQGFAAFGAACLHDEECASGTCAAGTCGDGADDAGVDAGADLDTLPPPPDAPFDLDGLDGPPLLNCGDGKCGSGETPKNCPKDCGQCGNGSCDPGESFSSCPQDCKCGNGAIDPPEVCDGKNHDNKTCKTLGYSGGTLDCKPDCKAFDTSGCV